MINALYQVVNNSTKPVKTIHLILISDYTCTLYRQTTKVNSHSTHETYIRKTTAMQKDRISQTINRVVSVRAP